MVNRRIVCLLEHRKNLSDIGQITDSKKIRPPVVLPIFLFFLRPQSTCNNNGGSHVPSSKAAKMEISLYVYRKQVGCLFIDVQKPLPAHRSNPLLSGFFRKYGKTGDLTDSFALCLNASYFHDNKRRDLCQLPCTV